MKHKKTTKKVKSDLLEDLIKVISKHQPCPIHLAELLFDLSIYSATQHGEVPLKLYSKLVNQTLKNQKVLK